MKREEIKRKFAAETELLIILWLPQLREMKAIVRFRS